MAPTNKLSNQNTTTTTTMMDSYFVGQSGAVKRIGSPHEHDVLSGRGGAINSHAGNSKFREWVRERKNRYNLARTKAEKASVANEVMDLVKNQSPPGRFLQRDQSSVTGGVTWWVEVDEVKAMAKTSQALREGAPSIRAAHKDELTVRKRRRNSKKTQAAATAAHKPTPSVTSKRSHQTMQPPSNMTMSSVPSMTVPAAPAPASVALYSSPTQAMEQLKANAEAAQYVENAPSYTVPQNAIAPEIATTTTTPSYDLPRVKRSRLSENLYLPQPHIVKPDDETPPLAPLPSPVPLNSIPELGDSFPMPALPKREPSLRRANSLALSDVGSHASDNWGDFEFVNPFEGDTSDEISTMPPPFGGEAPRVRSRNSISNMSIKSELSDLCDANAFSSIGMADSEFGEAMKDVYDAVHPGLDSSGDNEPIPTHLYPYRGSYDLTKGPDSHGSPQLII